MLSLVHVGHDEVKEESETKNLLAVVTKKIGLLQKVAALVHEPKGVVPRALDAHGEVLKAGVVMCGNSKKLEGLAKDAGGRLLIDSKFTVLLGVTNSRDSLVKALSACKQQAAILIPTPKMAGEDAPASDRSAGVIAEIWETDSAGCFKFVLESEVVTDCVSRACTQTSEKLRLCGATASNHFATVTGDKSWKKNLPADASLETNKAKQTLLLIPDKGSLKKAVETFAQDRDCLTRDSRT